MSNQIPVAYVKQYGANVFVLSQQKGSRLMDKVRMESVNANETFFERLGATTAYKITTRHMATQHVNTPHSRRRVTLVDYAWSDLIDKIDKIRMLIEPSSEYVTNAANAMGRAKDDEILIAMNGTAYAGVDGSTTVALPSGQKIGNSSDPISLALLLSAKEILDTNEVDPDEPRTIALRPKDVTSLLNTTEFKSSDYNSVKALAQGQLNSYLGFDFVMTNRVRANVAADAKAVMCWARRAMALAVGMEMKTRVEELQATNYSTQVWVAQSLGATRVEDEAVVEISVAT